MEIIVINEDMPVLVELVLVSGTRTASTIPKDLEQKSSMALNSAMNTIHQMAKYIASTIDSVPESACPSKVESKFGLKLTNEGNALIAKAGVEANIEVTLTWELKNNKN